jgi:FkbM family methyltransferase
MIWRQQPADLGVAVLIPSNCADVGVQQQEGRSDLLIENTAVASAALPLRCEEVLASRQSGMYEDKVVNYRTPSMKKPLTLHGNSSEIMGWILGNGGEAAVHRLLDYLFRRECLAANTTARANVVPGGVFVDVGANAGYYSMLALTHGCQSLMFDPQAACAALIQQNVCLNERYATRDGALGAVLINNPVSDQHVNLSLAEVAGELKCIGTFSVDVLQKQAQGSAKRITRETVVLDDLLLNSTLQLKVVKVDTEGAEVQVVRSMRRLLQTKRIRHLVVEVTPLFWKRDGIPRETVYQEFLPLLTLGCSMGRVVDLDLSQAEVVMNSPLDTAEKLRQYLVVRDYVQEDLYIRCPA